MSSQCRRVAALLADIVCLFRDGDMVLTLIVSAQRRQSVCMTLSWTHPGHFHNAPYRNLWPLDLNTPDDLLIYQGEEWFSYYPWCLGGVKVWVTDCTLRVRGTRSSASPYPPPSLSQSLWWHGIEAEIVRPITQHFINLTNIFRPDWWPQAVAGCTLLLSRHLESSIQAQELHMCISNVGRGR